MLSHAQHESCETAFQFWTEIYDDIERSIVQFLCIDDLKPLFVVSKKFNQMVIKLVYNQDNYNQSFDSTIILPAIKQTIIVQCFPLKKTDENLDDENDYNSKERQSKKRNKKIIEWIKLMLSKNVTISKWFVNYLINDEKYLIYNLLTCPHDNGGTCKREIFSQLIINALKTLKRFELDGIQKVNRIFSKKEQSKNESGNKDDETKDNDNELLSLKFSNLMVSLINETVPNYWHSMEQFWSIFEEILMFDHEYRYYFVNIEFISTLGYFYLQKESPYADEYPGKQEFSIYNTVLYAPVIHLINILIRSCHSPATLMRHNQAQEEFANIKVKMNEKESKSNNISTNASNSEMDTNELRGKLDNIKNLFKLPSTAMCYEKKEYSFDDYKCMSLLRLSDRDIKLPHQQLFWERMILDSYRHNKILEYVQEMFHHWCFNDKAFSDEIGKLIIQEIDLSDFHRVGTYLSIMEKLLSIDDDKLLISRFNQLFNCDSECIGNDRIDREKLQQRFVNKQTKYGKTIDVLDLIDYYSFRYKEFTFVCLRKIIKYNNNLKHIL